MVFFVGHTKVYIFSAWKSHVNDSTILFPKAERDRLEETRRNLERRLEGCETELRGKEDELFLQLERSLRLEEEIERAKAEKDSYVATKNRLEQQRESAFRRLQMQLEENEITRRDLDKARQDVIRQATIIRAERDTLEREVDTFSFMFDSNTHIAYSFI